MTPLLMCSKGLFRSSRHIPFLAHDYLFPSPHSSPQLPSYVEAYARILAALPSISHLVLPQFYDKFIMGYKDSEAVEE
jgi:hypothetical protein